MAASPSLDLTQRREHRLPGGRLVTYAAWGEEGPALFHHHGTGSSRFEAAAVARAARGAKLRVIGVDRPGYGGSDHDPARTFESFHRDVEHLADALGIGRFFVSGVSGGADFAAAAALLSDRVIKAYPLNMSPDPGHPAYRRVALWLRLAIPLLMTPKGLVKRARRSRDNPLGRVQAETPGSLDREVLLQEIPDIWDAAIREGARLTFEGIVRDVQLLNRPWRLDWTRQRAPIACHAGMDDPFRGWAHALAALQPNVTVTDHPGGHVAALGAGFLNDVVADVTGK